MPKLAHWHYKEISIITEWNVLFVEILRRLRFNLGIRPFSSYCEMGQTNPSCDRLSHLWDYFSEKGRFVASEDVDHIGKFTFYALPDARWFAYMLHYVIKSPVPSSLFQQGEEDRQCDRSQVSNGRRCLGNAREWEWPSLSASQHKCCFHNADISRRFTSWQITSKLHPTHKALRLKRYTSSTVYAAISPEHSWT